jgi:hypothetical protein
MTQHHIPDVIARMPVEPLEISITLACVFASLVLVLT